MARARVAKRARDAWRPVSPMAAEGEGCGRGGHMSLTSTADADGALSHAPP
jgi:hypothetical protein